MMWTSHQYPEEDKNKIMILILGIKDNINFFKSCETVQISGVLCIDIY